MKFCAVKAILACAARGWGARSFSRYLLHQSQSNAGWHDDTGWVHHYIAYAIDMIIILQFSALLILAEAADIPKDVKRIFVAICLLYCVRANFYTGRSLRSSKCPAFRIPSTFPRSKYIFLCFPICVAYQGIVISAATLFWSDMPDWDPDAEVQILFFASMAPKSQFVSAYGTMAVLLTKAAVSTILQKCLGYILHMF